MSNSRPEHCRHGCKAIFLATGLWALSFGTVAGGTRSASGSFESSEPGGTQAGKALADADKPLESESSEESALLGIVVDQTITQVGREFYRHFCATWRDRSDASRYSVAVYERPSARWGNLIWVQQNDRIVYRIFLSPRLANIETQANAAATQVIDTLADTALQELLTVNPDLSKNGY